MRLPFFSMFITSPFDGIQEHAEKVKECAWSFQQAMECHFSQKSKPFEKFRQEVVTLESQADAVKRRIRGHLPKGTMMPVDKFQLFRYLREQDHVLDSMEDVLDWLSYRPDPGIRKEIKKDFRLLIDAVVSPVEEMTKMVSEARKYFVNFSEKQRNLVKDIIRELRRHEHQADKLEDNIKQKVFNMEINPVTVFHTIRLAEFIGSIADHVENAGDMMRAMLSK